MNLLVTRSTVCPCCRADMSPANSAEEGGATGPRNYEEFRDQV